MLQLKRRRFVALVLAGITAASLAGPADAQRSPQTPTDRSGPSSSSREPLMAVVSLRSQRVTVYAGQRRIHEAPVSTGQSGYETPAGIYSVIERRRHHYSNLYNDAAMPYMQRLTWSGIALHAGALPGYPASHGCIRMPYGFAGQLFKLSRRGMRVVVVRDDMSPIEFSHPALFRPTDPETGKEQESSNVVASLTQVGARLENASLTSPPARRALAAANAAAAEAAAEGLEKARRAAFRAEEEAAEFEEPLLFAEAQKLEAEAEIAEIAQIEPVLVAEGSSALVERLKGIKAKALERVAAARAQIDSIYAVGKAKIDASRAARQEAKAARAANTAAQNALAASRLAPVSVFISRKTQRLYVRRAFQPLFESAVEIHKPNAAIGTTIFTALNYANQYQDLRWTALTMYPSAATRNRGGEEPALTDANAAKAALERISMPQDAIDRVNELISPGSSLIISDEAMSRETSTNTDFVVLMSREPQGGIGRRPRYPNIARGYDSAFPPGGFPSLFLWW